jgi:hypothetical protein
MSFLVLLNTLSHSVDITGIERVSQIQSTPLLRFASFLGRRNNNLLLSIFPGLSFTALGNLERPGSYYWVLLCITSRFRGSRLPLLTYQVSRKVTYS